LLWRQNNPEVNYSPTRISRGRGEGRVFLGETSRSIKTGMKIVTWNVRSLHRAAARDLARYKLDVVGVQEVRWDKGSTVREGDYDSFCGKEMKINWEQVFLYTVE
jgi:hypothetical protein